MAVKEVKIKVSQAGAEKVSGQMGKVDKSFMSIAKTALASVGAMYALKKAMDFAMTAKNAARDATEIRSKFNAVFKDMTDKANKMADDFADSFGLAGTSARELLGNTADLLTGFGYAQEAALEMAISTNQLAVDLASFTNYAGGAEGATSALVRAFTGEREALKSLGIVVSEEMVKGELLRLGKDKLTGQSLMQAKAEATLNIAYGQSKNAIGDYARTQDELANVERRRKEAQKELLEQMGNKLIPAFKDANLLALSFFKSLTQTDLEGTIDELKRYGSEVETINNLTALNIIAESYQKEEDALDKLDKARKFSHQYYYAEESARKGFIRDANDVIIKHYAELGVLQAKLKEQKSSETATRKQKEETKGLIDELERKIRYDKLDIQQMNDVSQAERGLSVIIESRTQAQRVLNGEVDQSVVTTKEYKETIDSLPFSFREVVVAIEEMKMATSNVPPLIMDIGKEWTLAINAMNSLGGQFSGYMSSAFLEMADSGEVSFKKLEKAFKNMLTRMVIEYASKAIIFAAFNAISGGVFGAAAGGLGGFLFKEGGIVPPVQYLASGGPARGSDTVPAMLTPGEVVLNKAQQQNLARSMGNTYNINIGRFIGTQENARELARLLQEDSVNGFNKIQIRA